MPKLSPAANAPRTTAGGVSAYNESGTRSQRTEHLVTFTLAFLVLIGVYLGFIALRDAQPTIGPGDVLTADDTEIFLLTGFSPSITGGDEVTLHLRTGIDSIDLLASSRNAHVLELDAFLNGRQIYQTTSGNTVASFTAVTIALPHASGGELTLRMSTDETGLIYLGQGQTMDEALSLGNSLRLFEMGLLFTVALYAASIFACKRSEGYMFKLALYATLLFLQALIFLHRDAFPPVPNLFVAARTFILVTAVLLSVNFGYSIMRVHAPASVWAALSVRNVMIVGTACALLAFLAWDELGSFISIAYNAVAVVAAIYGCLKTTRENTAVAIVFLVTIVTCTNGSLLKFLDLSRSFYYMTLFTAPLFSVPFALVVMIAMNRRLTDAFTEAEMLNIRLDDKVEERTRSLREEEAQRHQLMLNVFHDLRSPLFAIKGCTEIIEADPASVKELIPVVTERVEFMSRLTNDLFLLAKLEDDRVLFVEEEVEVLPLLHDSVRGTEALARSRGVRVRLVDEVRDGSNPSVLLICDGQRLKQIVDNLLVNAITYTDASSEVTVVLRATDGQVHVDVSDQGPGIPIDRQSLVFRQYYCADRSPESKSSGLGLNIARELARHMGGDITLSSVPGNGATFTVTLPSRA